MEGHVVTLLDKTTSIADETECINTDLDSLPEVIECVSQAQRFQSEQLSAQQIILKNLEENFEKEQEKLASLREELSQYRRELFSHEEEIVKSSSSCNALKNELENMIEDDLDLQELCRLYEEKIKQDNRIQEEYLEKITSHEELVLQFEKGLSGQQQLTTEKEHLQCLASEKSSIEEALNEMSKTYGNVPKQKMNKEIKELTKEKQEFEEKLHNEEAKLKEEQGHQQSLQQDINVLQKRNQAQLIRLRNQLKEAQTRNHQWHEEASQLEQYLTYLQNMADKQKDG